MTGDPLYRPLGVRQQPRRRWSRIAVPVALVIVILGGMGVLVWHGRGVKNGRDDAAIAPIEPLKVTSPPPAVSPSPPAAPPPVEAQAAPADGPQTLPNGDTVEVQHGVKIIRMGAGRPAKGQAPAVIASPADFGLQPAPDPLLVEHSPDGDIPKIGPNGERAADVYARPMVVVPLAKAGMRRIAIMVGDLGASPDDTDRLAAGLPADVSLVFDPDGPDVPMQVGRARQAGHEVLLEVPGASLARSDPPAGGAGFAALHRLMAKFTGYIGVTTPLEAALPAGAGDGLHELQGRGLLFVAGATALEDKGTAPDPPALQPDVTIDGHLAKASVDVALAQLESVARAKGSALAYVGELSRPDDIAGFASTLGAKGLQLVPVSALAHATAAAQPAH